MKITSKNTEKTKAGKDSTMFIVRYYSRKSNIWIRAYCDRYAISLEKNILYFISLAGADSAVRGIIAAIHSRENIEIQESEDNWTLCKKGNSSMRSFGSKIGYENLTHGVCVDNSAVESGEYREMLIVEDSSDALYAALHKNFSLTAIPAWKEWIYKKLQQENFLVPLHCGGMQSTLLQITEEQLDNIISAGVRSGELRFSKEITKSNSSITDIQGVESYLQKFAPKLANKINRNFQPLYLPEKGKWHNRVSQLQRTPFRAQGDAIMGAVEALKIQKSVNIVGEMGVGKSLIGASIPYVYSDKPYRVLIVCPGHLVRKWAAEIEKTVPKATTLIIRKYTDLIPIIERHKRKEKLQCPEYLIISKDKAKLSYYWTSAVIRRKDACICPDCAKIFKDEEGWNMPLSTFKKKKCYCEDCGAALWQADRSRLRRFAPAEFIKRYLKGAIDFLLCDEVHELKGGATAQGNVLGMLAAVAKKVVSLTGTLMSGYADDLVYILYRTNPAIMRNDGFAWGETQKWLERYGILERVVKTRLDVDDNSSSRGKRRRKSVKRKPGVSPLVYSKFLLGNTVFLQLDDISDKLPSLIEEVVPIEMNQELQEAYCDMKNVLGDKVKKELSWGGNSCLLGAYLLSLLCYPDRPYHFGPIVHPHAKRRLPKEYFHLPPEEQMNFLTELAERKAFDLESIIVDPPDLAEEIILPKEQALLDILDKELKQHRRCFIYCTFTGTRDVTARLDSLIQKRGYKTAVLKSTVVPEKREQWIKDKVDSGCEVILGNPELVKTGLDLLEFPSLIFYQTGYNTFTLRQSSRRSWRIGQKNHVKLYYLYYKGTMQEQALNLMGAKLEASMGVEGRFSEEGLIAMSSGDDMMNAVAKAIVGKLKPTDSVENIWKRMRDKAGIALHPEIVDIDVPESESPSVYVPRTYRIEFVRQKGRRKFREQIEVQASELDKMIREKGVPAQLLLF